MKAIQMTAAGAPEVLETVDLPIPEPADNEILVRVRAAGVNPVDAKLRSRGVFFENALPAVLGCDGAGVVEGIGRHVTLFQPGDEVWFCNGGLGREQGNYAEYTVVDERVARRKPASLDFEQAGAAPLVLITAWEALFDRAGLEAGQSVLIHGGAGGVGHVAIQLAKNAGARVCTTVGTDDNAEFALALGADRAINYHDIDFVEAVREWSESCGVDVALDIMGGRVFQDSIRAVAHYGALVTLLDPGSGIEWKEARNRNLRIGFELMLTPMLENLPAAREHQGEILDRCAAQADEGRLSIVVTQRFPLEQAAEAHRQIETGHTRGKLVLIP
ncbi:MAG TPA: alcohol dehydrogenase [Gammaproteobacteria bacterium]|nr:alcohol dehydrogenase [Gammaproteobacteria bacterium]